PTPVLVTSAALARQQQALNDAVLTALLARFFSLSLSPLCFRAVRYQDHEEHEAFRQLLEAPQADAQIIMQSR
ncbi:unnamed protein product, partial [Scytosiphon promiscuus]